MQVTVCSAVNSLQYATHCQHTTAKHITELLWQFIRCCPSYSRCQMAVHNTCSSQSVWLIYIATAGRPYMNFGRSPSATIFTFVGSAFLSNICLQHVQPIYITQPTLPVTTHNLPYNSQHHTAPHPPCHYTQIAVQQSHNVLCSEGHGMQHCTVFNNSQYFLMGCNCGWGGK